MPMASEIATETELYRAAGDSSALTSSICFSSTPTAGSAEIMNQPSGIARGD